MRPGQEVFHGSSRPSVPLSAGITSLGTRGFSAVLTAVSTARWLSHQAQPPWVSFTGFVPGCSPCPTHMTRCFHYCSIAVERHHDQGNSYMESALTVSLSSWWGAWWHPGRCLSRKAGKASLGLTCFKTHTPRVIISSTKTHLILLIISNSSIP